MTAVYFIESPETQEDHDGPPLEQLGTTAHEPSISTGSSVHHSTAIDGECTVPTSNIMVEIYLWKWGGRATEGGMILSKNCVYHVLKYHVLLLAFAAVDFKRPSQSTQVTPIKTRISSTCTGTNVCDRVVGTSVEMKDAGTQLNAAPISIELIESKDKEMRMYTGLHDFKLLSILHKYITTRCTCEGNKQEDPAKVFKFISTENQLLLTLMKVHETQAESYLQGYR